MKHEIENGERDVGIKEERCVTDVTILDAKTRASVAKMIIAVIVFSAGYMMAHDDVIGVQGLLVAVIPMGLAVTRYYFGKSEKSK